MTIIHRIVLILFPICICFFSPGCFDKKNQVLSKTVHIDASAWPAADELFKNDPHWLGADGAASIDLNDNRVLWLFGDSFIAANNNRSRKEAVLVRNSIAIQYGYDPEKAHIFFHWQQGPPPRAFFPGDSSSWFWPGHGIRAGDLLAVFLMKVKSVPKNLGFQSTGWSIAFIDNPDDDPSRWNIFYPYTPQNSYGILVGSGSVFVLGGHYYAFCSGEQDQHSIYLTRWSITSFRNAIITDMEWWSRSGWKKHYTLMEKPVPIFYNGQTEISAFYIPGHKTFLSVQTLQFGPSKIAYRTSDTLTGKWTRPLCFYKPEEFNIPDILIYSAKIHPELMGSDVIMTYSSNSLDIDYLLNNDIYYPRFIKGMFHK